MIWPYIGSAPYIKDKKMRKKGSRTKRKKGMQYTEVLFEENN